MTKAKRPAVKTEEVAGKVAECAGRIIELISAGVIVPERRVGESPLAARLKVPRATIRSALDYLETVGMMERKPRSGTFLKQISALEYCEVMDIRAELEGLAARCAAVRADPKELQDLVKLGESVDAFNQHLLKGEAHTLPKLVELDLKFHLAIASLSGNRRLVSTLRHQRLIESTFSMVSEPRPIRSPRDRPIPTHREVAEALASGDPLRAEQVIKQHILRTKEGRVGIFSSNSR